MSEPLLILGASARAAAWSARRAGFAPAAGDLFTDEDLRACCLAWRCERYPQDLARIAALAPPGPWMYTGGLENYPRLVDRIAGERPLWGNAGEALLAVRDPFRVGEVLATAGIPTPEVVSNPRGLPCDGSWLKKPRGGSGGWKVERVTAPIDPAKTPTFYYQQFVAGTPQSGVFVAAGGKAALLGVTEQLIGDILWEANPFADRSANGFASHNSEFRYAGSIGPLRLEGDQSAQWQAIGDTLSAAFGLVGLFGVDAVVAEDRIWPIEVNPRYTASVEIVERGMGVFAIALHAQACRDKLLPLDIAVTPSMFYGKAIVYARQATTIDERFARFVGQYNAGHEWPRITDIPPIGTVIAQRQPVVTVFAKGIENGAVRSELCARAADAQSMLGQTAG
jgi:predicted ATP-grasp superfamily ATP-dependent carboligase